MRRIRGFSLIELMIVVAVMGILATMAIPSYQQRVVRTQVSEALQLAQPLRSQILDFHRANGRFPADNAEAGLPPPELLIGNYVSGILVTDGALHVTLGHHVNQHVAGSVVSLRPFLVEGSPRSPMDWGCGLREPPPGMMSPTPNRTTVGRVFLPFDCF